MNLYNYVDSDPINATDPTGEILPALAIGYARCILACEGIKAVTNAAGLCDNTSCLTDCLNPINYLAVGQAYKSLKRTKRAGGCSLNSFTAETPVHAIDADGNPVLKAISEFKIGDKVLAKSEWKAEGEDLSYELVTDIISTPNAEQNWVHITLKGGDVLTATEGHPFSTPEGWRDAILLKKGGQLLLKGEDGDALTVQIEDIRTETKVLTTYNLTVANAHTYFVGKDAVLVHNGKWCGTYKEKSGGENWALKVFDRITGGNWAQRGKNGKDVRVGTTKDGRTANYHGSSTQGGRPTIEVGRPSDANGVKHRY